MIPLAWASDNASADVAPDPAQIPFSDSAAGDELRQRLTFDELHHDEQPLADLLERVDRGDVRAVDLRGGAGLAAHARDRFLIGGDCGREDLDRHDAARRVSSAFQTSPMPPMPICSIIR